MKKYGIILCYYFLILGKAYGFDLIINHPTIEKEEVLKISVAKRNNNYDLYIAIRLAKPDSPLFYIQDNNQLSKKPLPYRVPFNVDTKVVFELKLPQTLPEGKYEVVAAEMSPGKFSLKAVKNEIVTSTFELIPKKIRPDPEQEYPIAYQGVAYQFQIKVLNGEPPYQYELTNGHLPKGLFLDTKTGLIEGVPQEKIEGTYTKIKITDSKGHFTSFWITIKVFEILTFGKDGDYKSCDDFETIFATIKKYAEIRVQQGTYFCHDLHISIPNTSEDTYILGGWDKTFKQQTKDPKLTIFDAQQKGQIFNLSNYHNIQISDFTFQNSLGSAIYNYYNGTTVNHCRFIHNIGGQDSGAEEMLNSQGVDRFLKGNYGGALNGISFINNSYFYQNESYAGGAVANFISIKNSIFIENKANIAGAVLAFSDVPEFGPTTTIIINSLFDGNIATQAGGAVVSYFSFVGIHNTFVNNQATLFCGALCGVDTLTVVLNSIFENNIANQKLNDIEQVSTRNTWLSNFTDKFVLNIDYSLVNYVNTASDHDFFTFLKAFNYKPSEIYRSQITLGANLIRNDPLFVNIEQGDYHLSPTSPAIDKAVSDISEINKFLEKQEILIDLNSIYNKNQNIDLDGKLRLPNQQWDLGVYEY